MSARTFFMPVLIPQHLYIAVPVLNRGSISVSMRAISSKLELLSLNLELQKSEIKVVNQKTPITLRYVNDHDSLEN